MMEEMCTKEKTKHEIPMNFLKKRNWLDASGHSLTKYKVDDTLDFGKLLD